MTLHNVKRCRWNRARLREEERSRVPLHWPGQWNRGGGTQGVVFGTETRARYLRYHTPVTLRAPGRQHGFMLSRYFLNMSSARASFLVSCGPFDLHR